VNRKTAAFCLIFAALIFGGLTGLGLNSLNTQPAAAYSAEQVKTGPAAPAAGEGSPTNGNSPDVGAGTGFTYQGRLKNGGSAATGQFDFTFGLFDAASPGAIPWGSA
jgi:hypothetical protein